MLKLVRQRRISHTGKCRGSGMPAAARVRNSFVGSIAPPRSGSKPWSKAACRASSPTKEPPLAFAMGSMSEGNFRNRQGFFSCFFIVENKKGPWAWLIFHEFLMFEYTCLCYSSVQILHFL